MGKRGPKTKLPWDMIEADYRMGTMSLSALSRKYGCNPATISRRATQHNWSKDLQDEVRRRTRAALAASTDGKEALLDAGLEAAVRTNLAVVRSHRTTLDKAHRLIDDAFGRLARVQGEDHQKIARSHAGIIKDLSIAIRNLVPLERQAHNLDATSGDVDAPDAIQITFYRKGKD